VLVSVLPQVVIRNWRLKLSAFILSVLLWAIVTVLPRNREIMPSVPVRVAMNDPAWALAEPPSPTTVTVHLGGLTGPSTVNLAFIRVPIDQVNSADTVVRLRPDWVILGGETNVVVQSITPAAVALRFEPTLTTAIPLSLRTQSDFPAGLALVQPLGLSPQVTTVRGRTRMVEALDSVSLEPLDLSKITESGTYRVLVDTTGLGDMTFQPNSAQIAVNLQPAAERVLPNVPVVVEAPVGVDSTSLVPELATVQVTVRGALTLIEQTSALNVTAVVLARDLEGIAPGNAWSVPLRIRGLPALLRAELEVDSLRVIRTLTGPSGGAPPDTVRRDTLRASPASGSRR
jgi:YbbR domain-containing protein